VRTTVVALLLLACACLGWTVSRPPDIPVVKHTLDLGANEACAFADVNKDGRLDIVSGENWYEAPRWTRHKFRDLNYWDNYIDDFSDLPLDVNGDGFPDIITATWNSRKLVWMENPGKRASAWKEHVIDSGFPTEFAFLVDIDNDGNARELLPQFGDPKAPLAWYEWKDGSFVKHIAAPNSIPHGIGAGDVNGDSRTDILTPKGWLEAPADPRSDKWIMHPDWDLTSVGFLHVYDVDGDGLNDIVTAMAHDFGIFWLQQSNDRKWTRQRIDDSWSQAHATTLVDLNGDGHKDLLTGKRYMAHNGKDPGEREPLGIYWYEYVRAPGGKVNWVRHVVDYSTRTGGGMQIPVADLDGDGDVDWAVAGKSGLYLFENLTRGRRQP
jgi:hypothetical protein